MAVSALLRAFGCGVMGGLLLARAVHAAPPQQADCVPPGNSVKAPEVSVSEVLKQASPPVSRPLETDVLYSWQQLPDVLEWAATAPTSRLFNHDYLYCWRTPTATFAYGDVPIRLRLKPGVKFVEIRREQRDCRTLPAREKESSVYVIHLGENTTDYLVCSKAVVHSWSYGTAGTLREIRAELAAIRKDPRQLDSYGYPAPECPDCPFGRLDDQPMASWRQAALDRKLELLEKLARSSLPRVFCLEPEPRCEEKHFAPGRGPSFGEAIPAPSSPSPTLTANRKPAIRQFRETLFVDEALVTADELKPLTRPLLADGAGIRLVVVSRKNPRALKTSLELPPAVEVMTPAAVAQSLKKRKTPAWVAPASPSAEWIAASPTLNLAKAPSYGKIGSDSKDPSTVNLFVSLKKARMLAKVRRLGVGPELGYDERIVDLPTDNILVKLFGAAGLESFERDAKGACVRKSPAGSEPVESERCSINGK